MMMLHAAALGLPFLPVYGMMMGSGMTDCWALDKDSRKDLDKVHDHKLIPMQNPFRPEEQILALPVPRIDSAVIHVQRAGVDGTCSITGPVFGDVDLAIAAKRVIVTWTRWCTVPTARSPASAMTSTTTTSPITGNTTPPAAPTRGSTPF